MAIQKLQLLGVKNGIGKTLYDDDPYSYQMSVAVDPDLSNLLTSSGIKTGGILTPSTYAKFSGTEMTGYPKWIITQPKTTNSFVYASDGKLHSFDSNIAMRTADEKTTALPISLTNGAGNGAAYYNNFIYLALSDDVTQYGGMDQGATIAITADVWTGAKFSKTGLSNTTYPSVRGVPIPNHPMHVHGDNALYFGDVVNGQGVIHKIKTKKTTIEGDTDDGSVYNAIDLPFGFYPTDIESFGQDLVIAAIQTSGSSTIRQGNAELFFWDCIADSFYHRVPVPDPLCTALLNSNGTIYVFSGSGDFGARVSTFQGASLKQVAFFEEGVSPLAGAVDALGERLTFGSVQTQPTAAATVFSIGSKLGDSNALHNIARSSSTSASSNIVSALKYVQQASSVYPRLVIGWGDSDAKGLDKISTSGTQGSIWRSKMFNIGKKFKVTRIEIPLGTTVATGTLMDIKVQYDDGTGSKTLTQISPTNYPDQKNIVYRAPEIAVIGEHNLALQIEWLGTFAMSVQFPIEITIETYDDR